MSKLSKEIEQQIDNDGCFSERTRTIIKQIVGKTDRQARKETLDEIIKVLTNIRDSES